MIKYSLILLSTLVTGCGAKVQSELAPQASKQLGQSADASQDASSNIEPNNANTCSTSLVNLYSGASTDFRIIETISVPETNYSILKTENGWAKINIASLNLVAYAVAEDLCQNQDSDPDTSQVPVEQPTAEPTQPTTPGTPPNTTDISVTNIINLSEKFVGFSYWWGGARLEIDSSDKGTCEKINGQNSYNGHKGANGADCSGYVAKVWMLPAAMPLEKQTHPYSTDDFYNKTTKWDAVERKNIQKADALVYRSASSGHIVIYDAGDNWNQIMTYEAKGCAYGVVHNLRAMSTAYKGIRRQEIAQIK